MTCIFHQDFACRQHGEGHGLRELSVAAPFSAEAADERAICIKLNDAMVAGIGDKHLAARVNDDVRCIQIELAIARAIAAENAQRLSIGIEVVDTPALRV